MLSNIKPLAKSQQRLLKSIFHPGQTKDSLSDDQKKGIDIYRNNLIFTATRALLIAYPVLAQLTGEDVVRYLASELLEIDPPTTGDWGDWGQPLESLITTTALAQAYPFLQDIIKLEWAIHQSSRCDAKPMDTQSLAQIKIDTLLNATIQLSPAVHIVTSEHPIDHIWQAHQSNGDSKRLDESALAEAFETHSGQCQLLIYQHHHKAHVSRLTDQAFQWISDVSKQYTVSELIDKHPDFDFINWLANAINQCWISNLMSPHQVAEKNNLTPENSTTY